MRWTHKENWLFGSEGEKFELEPHSYWYIAPTRINFSVNEIGVRPLDFAILLNNAAKGGGYVNGLDVLLADLKPQSHKNGVGLEAENFLEEVRIQEFPSRPSRLRSYFLNQKKSIAEIRQNTLKRTPSKVVQCYLLKAFHKIHLADMGLYEKLDGGNLDIRIAREYWAEFAPQNPDEELRLEVLVEGDLYFPDWQSFELIDQNSLGLWNEMHSK